MSAPPILTSALLAQAPGVRHGFFTRQGGVSEGLYASLNLGRGSRDAPERVEANRGLAAGVFGRPAQDLVLAYQVHSDRAVFTRSPWPGDPPQADAVITDRPGLICGALAADCAPVLLADPAAGLVGAVHAGWRGALSGVVEAAVREMVDRGASPDRMFAAVGPCIGPASYEVGLEFMDRFMAEEAANAVHFRPGAAADKRLFDLPGFVLGRLARAGVARAEWIGRDTLAEPDHFYSNRRAVLAGEGDYGRLLSVILLEG